MDVTFLFYLNQTLNNCTSELDDLHSLFCVNPDTYTILPPHADFYFINDRTQYYNIEFLIVRFMTYGGTYVFAATNLSEEEFPLEEFKILYKMHWIEETSFCELKYTIGLSN